MTAVAFVLGRPPGRGSVLPGVVEALEGRGLHVSVDVASEAVAGPLRARLCAADLLVLRGLPLPVLQALCTLDGVAACNPVDATIAARDKAQGHRRLRAAGVPVPEALFTDRWGDVRAFGAGRAVVAKAVAGSRGRGVHVGDRPGSLPDDPPFAGPWLVEERVPGDGRDRKLYVIGGQVRGVLRTWPPRTLADKLGTAFEPAPDLAALGRAAAAAVGLTLAGVDVIAGPRGPVVVDVNAFPGFKGVPDAAPRIAAHLAHCWRAATAATGAVRPEVTPCAS